MLGLLGIHISIPIWVTRCALAAKHKAAGCAFKRTNVRAGLTMPQKPTEARKTEIVSWRWKCRHS
jgi:hypothetical protein